MADSGGMATTDAANLELRKEELVVGKRQISNGAVVVRRVVQTENVSQPVELQREEYVIERIPASDLPDREAGARSADNAFQEQQIFVPLTREEPVASIRGWQAENVQVAKKIETDHVTITRPVRTEDVEITKVAGQPAVTLGQISGPMANGAPKEANSDNLQLAREELVVGKRQVDNGGVRLQKVIRTQDASQPLDLTREEYTVNRTPLSGPAADNAAFSPREIRLDLTREEPVVSTRNYVTEVVRVRKQTQTDKQTVTGVVRKETVDVVKLAANQPAQGGTSGASQSGTNSMSGSGSFLRAPDDFPHAAEVSTGTADLPIITITGNCVCAKHQLKQTATCQNAIQVEDGTTTRTYYLVPNDVTKDFHENVCKESKRVMATGSVQEMDGKLEFTPTKLELAK
jgi:uncharacterized protein (TIGR02271 family)